jgi:hypothetical protein
MSNEELTRGVAYPSPFDQLVAELANSAARYMYILSPRLDYEVFDNPDLVNALSELARSSRQTEIRILISDSRGLVARGHRLLALARRIPSTVRIQKIEHHPQWKGQTVVIRDRDGLLYKPADTNKEAFYLTDSRPETKPYLELFEELWRFSSEDPELRALSL